MGLEWTGKNSHYRDKTKRFFEGWFFKHQTSQATLIVIPGVNIDKDGNMSAFIQVVTRENAFVVTYSGNEFFADETAFFIRVGNSFFSTDGVFLNIEAEGLVCKGKLYYGDFTPVRYDVMGVFGLLQSMECYHGIVSLHHTIQGTVQLNGADLCFDSGVGYIEKDWGSSFPRSYVWFQCNEFSQKACVMVSIARIPMGVLSFEGLIAVFYYKGCEYRFATYNGGKVLYCDRNRIGLQKGRYMLKILLNPGEGRELKAPKMGGMVRIVRESVVCMARVLFYVDREKVFDERVQFAGFEEDGYANKKGKNRG